MLDKIIQFLLDYQYTENQIIDNIEEGSATQKDYSFSILEIQTDTEYKTNNSLHLQTTIPIEFTYVNINNNMKYLKYSEFIQVIKDLSYRFNEISLSNIKYQANWGMTIDNEHIAKGSFNIIYIEETC